MGPEPEEGAGAETLRMALTHQ